MIQAQTKRGTFLQRCTVAIGIVSIGAQLGVFHWAGDILALVADSYLWISLLLVLGFVRVRDWRWALIASSILLLNGYNLTSYARVQPVTPVASERNLRLLVYNIYYLNNDLDQVVETVKQSDADIVFLMEYSDDVQQQIEGLFVEYPYRLIQPSRFTMGLALFSRIPLEEAVVHRFQDTRIPIYQVQMRVAGQPFTFVGGHPWPPQPQWGQLHRDQMREIIRIAAQAPSPLIIAGDFNAAPWSYTMRELATQADLRQVRQNLDVRKTWFALPFLGLPLDHVLLSEQWQLLDYQYGAQGGSDHVPIVIDLHLR